MAYVKLTIEDQRFLRRFVNRKLAGIDQSKVGLTNITQHEIIVGKNAIPYRRKPHKKRNAAMEALYEEVDNLIERGYIIKDKSDWSSQARMVKNKDGEWRFCTDYSKLNSYIKTRDYPVHNQLKTLQSLRNACIISTIRINEAFHHIKLKPQSRKYTAFEINGRGVYVWVRMPYGLKGALSTYCYVADRIKKIVFNRVNSLYQNIRVSEKIFVCLEDWIVISETPKEHEILLDCLLDVLYENGIDIDVENSQFVKESIDYIGFTVDYDGIHICQKSIKPIIDYPRPKNVSEVRQFNGMVNHYRNHIKDLAMIQRSLNKFCAKNAVFKWSEEEESSFLNTKEALLTARSVSVIDPNLPFRLFTYVTCTGLGAILIQYNEWVDCENLITYISRLFKGAEKNYPMIEKNILSVVWALSKVKDLIKRRKCKVFTDSSVLSWYKNKKSNSYRLSQWATILPKYNITLCPW